MEDSDDNLSFVSASEIELEAEAFQKLSFVRSSEFVRQNSPAPSVTSLCSFRRTKAKRPAPQPPVKAPEIDVKEAVGSECENKSISMPSFVPQVNIDVEHKEGEMQQCKPVDGLVSHPINFLPPETSAASSPQQVQNGLTDGVPSNDFCKLQLRMIDDLMEPLQSDFPPPTGIPSTPPIQSYPYQTIVSYPLQSPIYSSPIYSTLMSQVQPSNQGPFYMASVHGQNVTNGLSNFPIGPTQLLENSAGSTQYVTVAPLAYVPQMPPQPLNPLSASLSSNPGFGGPLLTQKTFNPLSHSASDPGVHRMVTSCLSVPPQQGPSLERLSEGDEDDNSYEDVFVADESSDKKDLVPVRHNRRRLERSDSVTVAHLYEDIIISTRWNLKVTFTNLTMVVIGTALFLPNSAAILYNFFRLVFGTLFPAYYSYKAVRTKNVKEYVKWMMYWIVFAFFTCAETITDVFLSFWFPFYYEIKILVVLWLLSPATRGSSILYRKFVHPWLTRKEEEIDECIAKAKQQGYTTVVQLGTKGVNYATSVIMQTAIKGGGGLVNQLKRSYSTSEIGEDTADHNSNVKALTHKEGHQSPSEDDDVMSISSGSIECETRHRSESESLSTRTRGHSTGRSMRTGKTRSADVSDVYFHEPEPVVQRRSPRTHDAGRTTEGGGHTTTTTTNTTRRSRSGDIYATLPRTTTKRTAVKKRQA